MRRIRSFLPIALIVGWLTLPLEAMSKTDPTEGATCTTCQAENASNRQLTGFISDVQDELKITDCAGFVKDDEIGPWGKVIVEEFQSGKFPALSKGSPDLIQACPRYPIMSKDEKSHVWVLIINAMSFYESSCRSKVNNAGAPDGTAAGLLQLNLNKEHLYKAPFCRKGDSLKAARSVICGMSMLEVQLANDQSLFDDSSYWDVLEPRQPTRKVEHIINAVASYAPCTSEIISKTANPN